MQAALGIQSQVGGDSESAIVRTMKSAGFLTQARRAAGMTQRQLAEKAGVPQSTVARIESGAMDPRSETLGRLLRACDQELAVRPRLGVGIDRSLIREHLKLSPRERIETTGRAAKEVARLFGRAKRVR